MCISGICCAICWEENLFMYIYCMEDEKYQVYTYSTMNSACNKTYMHKIHLDKTQIPQVPKLKVTFSTVRTVLVCPTHMYSLQNLLCDDT